MPSAYEEYYEPLFRIGDMIRLNSGGPRMMIVDVSRHTVVAAWRDEEGYAVERAFPVACVRRS